MATEVMNFETVSSLRRITPDSEDDRRETSSLVRSGCEPARIDSSDIERKKRCGRVVWSAIFVLFDWIREKGNENRSEGDGVWWKRLEK